MISVPSTTQKAHSTIRSRPGKSKGKAKAVARVTRPRMPLQDTKMAPRGSRAAQIGMKPAPRRLDHDAIGGNPGDPGCDHTPSTLNPNSSEPQRCDSDNRSMMWRACSPIRTKASTFTTKMAVSQTE